MVGSGRECPIRDRSALRGKVREQSEERAMRTTAERRAAKAARKAARKAWKIERAERAEIERRKAKQRQRELRCMPYQEYLQTNHWRRVKQAALERSGFECSICGCDHSLQVHHKTYKRKGREKLKDLQVLCGGCHQNMHEGEKPFCFDPLTRAFINLVKSF